MAAIDHLVFVSPDVEAGVAMVEARSGVRAVPGGSHAGRGTRNSLLAFDDSTYLEIIGIDDEQPAPQGPRPFGVTETSEPRLATFAVHPTGDETLEDVVQRLSSTGVEFGPPAPMSRMRPDGGVLSWRLALPRGGDGVVPFVIDWAETPNPAASLPVLGGLRELRVSPPDVAVWDALDDLDERVVVTQGPVSLTAYIATPRGDLTLSTTPSV